MSEDTLKFGKEIISDEAKALGELAERLDENFCHAIDLITEISKHGHVVVSGMGKAGLVGMKISATLASVGVPSFFLNPAEAIHGDLGRYTKQDLALILSYSGETGEILRILPLLKRLKCPIISITANAESNLAQASDVTLQIGKVKETGPLALAPTTSTTMMLALGDALAMAMVKRSNFSREEFAFFHSGGSLGRALKPINMVMRTGDMQCIVPETMTAREVLERITATKGRPGAATVVDKDGKLSGFFTDGNFRRCLVEKRDFLEKPIGEVATRNPKTVNVNGSASDALQILATYKIDQVVVVDDAGYPVGLIDIQDLIEVQPLQGIEK